ncbi:MAG TPA: hypothetical protein VJQ52_20005 [Steroidobacteraceae bacterium]|nr:hypothetical protein [Steroidobacteraceae bacterium]
MTFWMLFLGSCGVGAVLGTLLWKRPMVAAISVSVLAGMVIALHDMSTSPFSVLAMIIATICSLPVTVVAAIVTENLMDKYAPHWKD